MAYSAGVPVIGSRFQMVLPPLETALAANLFESGPRVNIIASLSLFPPEKNLALLLF